VEVPGPLTLKKGFFFFFDFLFFHVSNAQALTIKIILLEVFSMEKVIRVGMMPGRIEEYAVEVGTPISEVLAMAGLDPTGYDVKVDGIKITDFNTPVTQSTNLILLAKQVKGN
jgi:hypothetical protein